MTAASVCFAGVACSLTACQWIAGFDFTSGAPDAASPPVTSACDVLPAKKDAPGGEMLLVKAQPSPIDPPCFWIDETEVSVTAYDAWRAGDAGAWPAGCTFKVGEGGTAPSDPAGDLLDTCRASISTRETNPFDPHKPIRCVDWCDAERFCQSMGKRLCYGDANSLPTPDESSGDEWGYACSPPKEATVYPWGDESEASRCNVDQEANACNAGFQTCGPIPTTSFTDCHADGGARELIGNVAEWTHLCVGEPDGGTSADALCQVRGGSYADLPGDATCESRRTSARGHRDPQTGIRCCADLTSSELARLPP